RVRYAELYGRGAVAHGADIELVNCRVIGIGRVPRPTPATAAPAAADARVARRGVRFAWLPDGGDPERARVTVYDGERLASGMAFAGPGLVDRRYATILVPAGDRAAVDAHGSSVIDMNHA